MTRAWESWKIARYRDNYFYFEDSADKIKIIEAEMKHSSIYCLSWQ